MNLIHYLLVVRVDYNLSNIEKKLFLIFGLVRTAFLSSYKIVKFLSLQLIHILIVIHTIIPIMIVTMMMTIIIMNIKTMIMILQCFLHGVTNFNVKNRQKTLQKYIP